MSPLFEDALAVLTFGVLVVMVNVRIAHRPLMTLTAQSDPPVLPIGYGAAT